MKRFKNVIVRIPGRGISEGITSNPELGKPGLRKCISST